MKLSIQSLARKLSLPSPKRGGGDNGTTTTKKKRSLSRGETPSFASSTSSSSDDARSTSTPRSVLLAPSSSPPPLEIPRRELEAVLRRLGHAEPSDAELDAVAALAAQPPPADDASGDLMEAFRVFDADGDGRITAEELRAVLDGILGAGGCSLDDCRRMIGGVDADGDGFVGFQDFARMMMMTTTGATAAATADDARTFL